jgi:hypothetical protein
VPLDWKTVAFQMESIEPFMSNSNVQCVRGWMVVFWIVISPENPCPQSEVFRKLTVCAHKDGMHAARIAARATLRNEQCIKFILGIYRRVMKKFASLPINITKIMSAKYSALYPHLSQSKEIRAQVPALACGTEIYPYPHKVEYA